MPARCQYLNEINLAFRASTVYSFPIMDPDLLRQARLELARQGGLARAKSMTAEERRKSAKKASDAAAVARTKKARQKRGAQQKQRKTK